MHTYIKHCDAQKYHFVNKSNLRNVLLEIKFCGFCLGNDRLLFYLNDESSLENNLASSYLLMVKQLFGNEFLKEIPSKYVCNICKDNIEHTFSFTNKVKNTHNLLEKYMHDIQTHVDEVDEMLDTTQDNVANTVIILQEHKNDNDFQNNNDNFGRMTVAIKDNEDGVEPEIVLDNEDDSINDYNDYNIISKSEKSYECGARKVHKQKKVKCNQCKSVPCAHERYLSPYKIQKLKFGSESKLFVKCIDCDYVCSNKSSLLTHANRIHLKICPFLCEKCGQSFHSRDNHFLHMKNIHPDSNICLYCDINLATKQDLCDHIDNCRKEERKHKCDSCVASFDTAERLEFHKETHDNKMFCDICLKTFRNETAFKRHKARAHTTQENYYNVSTIHNIKPTPKRVCSICAAEFSTLPELKLHVSNHDADEKHSCFICNEQFNTYRLFKRHTTYSKHLRKLYPKVRLSFACQYCEFTCKVNRDLEHHTNLKHLKIKPYGCHSCNKKFTTKYHLKGHEQTHTGIKKYPCSECNNSFTTTTGLRKHIYRLHAKDKRKPYACTFCDQSFVYQSEYDLHKLRKHSERSVQCPLCEAKFHSIANAKRHIISVHAKLMKVDELIELEKSKELEEILRDHRLSKMQV